MPTLNQPKCKRSCECLSRSSNSGPTEKYRPVKKEHSQRSTPKCSKEGKTCSTGVISNYTRTPVTKPKKTTRSDLCFTDKTLKEQAVFDYCKKCGDAIDTELKSDERSFQDDSLKLKPKTKTEKAVTVKKRKEPIMTCKPTSRIQVISETCKNLEDTKYRKLTTKDSRKDFQNADFKKDSNKSLRLIKSSEKSGPKKPVQQFYKNENFRRVSLSSQEICKYIQRASLLDTIKELPEVSTAVEDNLGSDLETNESDSDDDILIDPDNFKSLSKLRNFREENYFECHSAKSRIKSRDNASLLDHKCSYKFYLNDRLFPVPLNTDHHKTIRCSECYLPLDLNGKKDSTRELNGTIQAKVKLDSGDEAQDMVLMLPVKESLIIQEKRKETPKRNEECLYFGVIKLDNYGNSIFSPTLPSDSFALKYQKGYKEHVNLPKDMKYERVEEGDVIVI